jgi:Tol biopolymer transport system component
MDELETRFQVLDELVMPELWSRAQRRTPTSDRTPEGPPRGPKRLLIVAAALAMTAAATLFLFRAFGSSASVPVAPTPSPTQVRSTAGRLAVVDVAGSTERIVLVNADGSGLTDLVQGRDPAWSPDGTQIAFRTGNADHPGGNPTSISVIDADGSHEHALDIPSSAGGETSGGAGPAVWSPDGTQIAFATVLGIYVMRPDGSDLHRVSKYDGPNACYDLEPAWSPDSQRIVFADRCDGGEAGLSSMDADGNDRNQLLSISDQIQAAAYPSFSPDGLRISFVGASSNTTWSIYVMDADGSNVAKVADDAEAGWPLAWSPDGSMISFTQAGTGLLNALEVSTGSVHAIPTNLAYSCCAAWQPVTSGISATPSGGPGTQALAGVPFPVCRPTSVTGTFLGSDDSAWTFSGERSPGSGCSGSPGMQYVAIGTANRVDAMSRGTTEKMGVEGWWAPYATPDLDGDGVDEIVVATASPGSDWAIHVWLYRQGADAVEPVSDTCGGACSIVWNTSLGEGLEESGGKIWTGLACGSVPSAPELGNGVLMWQHVEGLPSRLYTSLYKLKDGSLIVEDSRTVQVSGPDEYPPTGEQSICGSVAHQPPTS